MFGKAALSLFSSSSTPTDSTGKASAASGSKSGSCFHVGVSSNSVCALCNKGHDLEVCQDFVSKSLSQRRDFILSHKLCFGCLQAGHLARSCKKRRKCQTCGNLHPTTLHGARPAPQRPPAKGSSSGSGDTSGPATSEAGTSEEAGKEGAGVNRENGFSCDAGSSVWHAVLPVQVRQKGKPKIVNTYAFSIPLWPSPSAVNNMAENALYEGLCLRKSQFIRS